MPATSAELLWGAAGPQAAKPAGGTWQGEVACSNACIVRAQAALDSRQLGELKPGTKVLVDAETQLPDGKQRAHLCAPLEGWVTAKMVRRVEAAAAAAAGPGSVAPSLSASRAPAADCDEVTDLVVPEGKRLRLFLISDIHVDHKANLEWLGGCLSCKRDRRACFDCLLLPGDVTNKEELFAETMALLAGAFEAVFFCFGNHDVWTRGERKGDPPCATSLEKLDRVHRVCREAGVYTSPARVQQEGRKDLLLLPLWSWYHSSWDTEPDLPPELQPPIKPGSRVMDFRMCKWGPGIEGTKGYSFGDDRGLTSTTVAAHFAARNEAWMRAAEAAAAERSCEVVTFSHFCPRIELVLEKRNCYDQQIAKVQGSDLLEKQIRSLRQAPACHVFGHTHVGWDMVLEGQRYLHWPLGNTSERQGQTRAQNDGGFLLLCDDGKFAPQQFLHWSYHYDYLGGRRVPGAADLAPWVSQGYARTYPQMVPELQKQGLLREPDSEGGFSAFFPGGKKANDLAWWARHFGACGQWRLPPTDQPPLSFPCEDSSCILCRHTKEHEAKSWSFVTGK